MTMEMQHTKTLGRQQSSSKGEIYSTTILPQIDNLTLHLKQLEKEEQKTPKSVEGNKS